MSVPFLHTNDFHGRLTPELADAIRARKEALGALYVDCGDCIKTGNLGIPLRREEAWENLARAGCDVGTIGNRETHILTKVFEAKIDGHQHPLLVANMRSKKLPLAPPGERGPGGEGTPGNSILPSTLILTHNGLKIGFFGVMVPMVTERMKTQAASAFLWDSPIETARRIVPELRKTCDLVVALTHIGHRQDRLLAETVAGIDIIFGAHSHTVLESPERVGNTWIAQGGSHGRFYGEYVWDKALTGHLVRLSG